MTSGTADVERGEAPAPANRLPVTILTGFLGSGKTTLLNRLLNDPRLTDTAVIVNEFGEIGLDHLLVERALDQTVLMDNGCLCCSVRGDLVDTLDDLLRRVAGGALPGFGRVIIETTGLADPAPIIGTLVTEPGTAGRFRLNGVVTAVDGLNGAETLAAYGEARSQAAMADLVLVTKNDLPDAAPARVRQVVRALNPHADVIDVAEGAVDPQRLLDLDAVSESDFASRVANRSAHSENDGHAARHAGAPGTGRAAPAHRHDGHDDTAHLPGHFDIRAVSIVFDGPVAWPLLRGWLEWMTALRGPDILRIKGIVAVEGQPGPVLVQGVQHVFFPPRLLADWPDADRRSRIVIIARGVPEEALRASFDRYAEAAAATAA